MKCSTYPSHREAETAVGNLPKYVNHTLLTRLSPQAQDMITKIRRNILVRKCANVYTPWKQASDSITPHLQWNAPGDLRYNWMLFNRNHRRSLPRQIEENESYHYWDDGFALLQAQTLTDNTMPLNHSLHVQTLNYMVTATYVLFLWTYPFSSQSRNPFTIYPGLKTASYSLVFHSSQEVINIMDSGQNVIWSNVPGRLQAWLKLLSAPGVENPSWRQQGRGRHWYLCPPGGRVRYQNMNYCAREREFGWFINGAPATVRGAVRFSTVYEIACYKCVVMMK